MLRENISLTKWALSTALQPLLETWRVECMAFVALEGYDLVGCLSWQWIGLVYTNIPLVEAFKADCTS